MTTAEPLFFASVDALDAWLTAHPAPHPGLWVKVAKKGSGIASVDWADVNDVALCHGWITGQRKALDESHFLQKITPRRPGSLWSMVNVRRIAELTADGRMRLAGLTEVEAAKADGRWEGAYESQKNAGVPEDLTAALERNPRAREAFEKLGKTDRYQVMLGLLQARTPEARSARLSAAVAKLEARCGQRERMPHTPALLVIDMQNALMPGAHRAADTVAVIAALRERARAAGVPVVTVQHRGAELVPGTDGWCVVPELAPAAGEPVVHKINADSFLDTDLDRTLKALDVTEVIVTGYATEICVDTTARQALSHGYDLLLVADGHLTSERDGEGAYVAPARSIAHHNEIFRHLDFPGRGIRVLPAADVDFTGAA